MQGLRGAEPLELAGLQHAQQLGLHLERQLADLVEEDRAPVRQLEAAGRAGDRAGEGALLVAEELALDERGGQGRAVHRDERPAPAGAAVVDGARHQLLAGPGLAEHEHRRVGRRHLAHLPQQRGERRAPADDLLELARPADLLLQDHVLGLQALLELAHLAEALLERGLRPLQLGDVRPVTTAPPRLARGAVSR